jgi:catechol 2,3-dioxygenase-like lactoylglutathione lyase family enzyme
MGRTSVELVAFDPPGLGYPAERASNDQWFQHLALVCRDIAAARTRLEGGSPGVITEGGPVLLPPNTGSVTAFKFRDPEGHPLELISFPDGVGAPVWHQIPGPGILGLDHTAISVMDVDRSIAFYTELLGFRVGGRTLNKGPEQDRLDGSTGCEVDVVALEPASVATPHVELLHYRTPPGRLLTADVRSNDVASVRQVHSVDGLDALVARFERADVRFVSPGVVTSRSGGRAAAVRDPDGHMIILVA